MNRRSFIQLLTASAIAAGIPVSLIDAAPVQITAQFKRIMATSDLGAITGIGVQAGEGESRRRLTISMPTENWKSLTDGQREESFQLVERRMIELITRR